MKKIKWTKAHFNWLSDIAMPHPAQQIVFQEYIDTVVDCKNRVQRLTEQVRHQSQQSRQHELIKALQSMRGISLIVAATIAAELGDLTRFERPGMMKFKNHTEDKTTPSKKKPRITEDHGSLSRGQGGAIRQP